MGKASVGKHFCTPGHFQRLKVGVGSKKVWESVPQSDSDL